MKNLLRTASASIASLAVSAPMALAECTLNGEEIPCEELEEMAGPFLAAGLGIFLLLGVFGIAATVFWIMMLVHAATHDIKDKAMWIILMVFTGIVGAVIYYFVVKKKMK